MSLHEERYFNLDLSLEHVRQDLRVRIRDEAAVITAKINEVVTRDFVLKKVNDEINRMADGEYQKIVAAALREAFQHELWSLIQQDPELRESQRQQALRIMHQIKNGEQVTL